MSEADKLFEELGYKLETDTYFGGQNYTYKLIDENGKVNDFIRFKYEGSLTLEEVYQSEANLTYAIKMNFPELMTKEDVQNLIDYLNHESIPKDEIRKKIEQLEFLRDDAIEDNFLGDARNLKERIDILQELLGE